MKLHHSPTSPYVRKVMVVAHLTGQADALEIVPASGTPTEPDAGVVASNPLGKIPCLVTDDGRTLVDSRVICRFLDAEAGAGLYPQGDFAVLTREAMADGIMDAGILAVYEHRLRPEEIRFEPFRAAQIDKMRRAIAALEAEAEALEGETRIDHVAIGCALGYADLRFPDLGWRADAPRLAAWEAIFAATQPMADTRPPQ